MERFQPTDTVLAVDFEVKIEEVAEAKKILAEYGSRYSADPHLTLLLIPATEDMADMATPEMIKYLENQNVFDLRIANLTIEEVKRFVYFEGISDEVTKIHRDLLDIALKYRKNELRPKDIERIDKGIFSDAEIGRFEKYGFVRAGEAFENHVTIGEIPPGTNTAEAEEKMRAVLIRIDGMKYRVEKIRIMFFTDAPNQKDMGMIWVTEVDLNNPDWSDYEI